MKRIVFACVLLVLASYSTNVLAQSKKPISRDGLVSAVKVFFDALKADDLDKVKSHYATDYSFTGPDGKMGNAEDRLRTLKAQAGSFVSATDLTYRLFGDAAVVTGVATNKTPTGATEQSRFLQVWVMQGGGLRLVASQVTKME